MRSVLAGILRALESVVMTVLGLGCVFGVLLAVALLTVWLLLR